MPELGPIDEVIEGLVDTTSLTIEDILVVGAAARDLVIVEATGQLPARATEDVDIAVGIASWPAYEDVIRRLEPVKGSSHKFNVRGVEVDLVPFDGIESPERTVRWPDDMLMNVIGFREAYESATQVEIANGMAVKVATLEAQLMLKLFAWSDRQSWTKKDAIDLRSILDASAESPFVDSLYDEDLAVLERHEYDPGTAAAHRLGRDAARLLEAAERGRLIEILDTELSDVGTLAAYMGASIARNRELLEGSSQGMRSA